MLLLFLVVVVSSPMVLSAVISVMFVFQMGHYGGGRQSSSYDAAGASRSHHYDARYRPY